MTAPHPPSIDLNSDLGESNEPAQRAVDLALLDLVSSANIACGGHAGDETTMSAIVEAALDRGVELGAHPSYPDRANFGRTAMEMHPASVEALVGSQIDALHTVICSFGGRLAHVKAHGALYHRAMTDEATAGAIGRAAARIDTRLIMVAMPGSVALRVWREMSFAVAVEAFADRAYEADGTLRARTLPGALITDPAAAAAQAVALARSQTPAAGPHTLCIHSDTPHAVTIAAAVRVRMVV